MNSKFDNWNDNLQSFNREKNEAPVPVFYADWTSVPVPRTSSLRGLDVGFIPLCQRSCLTWRTMTNTMTNTYVVIFLSVSIFGRGYHSRYQNFEFTVDNLQHTCYHQAGASDANIPILGRFTTARQQACGRPFATCAFLRAFFKRLA